MTKSAISQYLSGKYEPKQKSIYLIAKALNVSESWLMGFTDTMDRTEITYPDNLHKVEKQKIPILGIIAAGIPIYADEQFERYVELGASILVDFCLKVRGDSMINARIQDGDIVFIRKQSDVLDGKIAAVLINDEATLKRVYKTSNQILLVSENPNYKPLVYEGDELNNVRILGKAIAFKVMLPRRKGLNHESCYLRKI